MRQKALDFVQNVLKHVPSDWINLTTHRLDIYKEELAKKEFLQKFEELYEANDASISSLSELPTAYDYIRLGHPLSTVLEWSIGKMNALDPERVICFDSITAPILAVLRKNIFEKRKTLIAYQDKLPVQFDTQKLREVYGYLFDVKQVSSVEEIPSYDGSVVFLKHNDNDSFSLSPNIDFTVAIRNKIGSIILVNKYVNEGYIAEIQHVRRRETIAMTPSNCLDILNELVNDTPSIEGNVNTTNKEQAISTIAEITGAKTKALLGSSGLSIQYAIMMGLIDDAQQNHNGKEIKIVVPPNCYGGTNDQARRVAATLDHVEVVDLLVDGDNDMVQSIDSVLDEIAKENAIPYIIAEIPTNPRVEVPDLLKLKEVLGKERETTTGKAAIDPVFILDQTFCPNVQFLGEDNLLSSVRTISYVSGSKFPSGGKCTAGYCVSNEKAKELMVRIEQHLYLCDNQATELQTEILAKQLPSMNTRIAEAYQNTREFVNFIGDVLPTAKINFVSEELASQGFTPSVFSLDLPTKGESNAERETYKRELNNRLINLMIGEIPNESKYCVSYGQLKGCYWTIPATSTQGTTKEADKDYIARVAVSPDLDLERHKAVFSAFVKTI